jgi:hypothetical protein
MDENSTYTPKCEEKPEQPLVFKLKSLWHPSFKLPASFLN